MDNVARNLTVFGETPHAMAIPNSYDILQAVVEATPEAIFVKDLNGCYILVNTAAARFVGKPPSEILGKKDIELYHEDTARQFTEADRQVLSTGQPQAFEGVATGYAGTQSYLVTKGVYRGPDGKILGMYGISHDVTELTRAREALEQTREALFRAQKMEAVGQLTGGIAHDFNNILAIVLGNVELLRIHLASDPSAVEITDTVIRAIMHGKDLTHHLLAFSGRRMLNPQPLDLNAQVENIVRFLGRTLGETIHVSAVTGDQPVTTLVDSGALEAALLNVAVNARDAMPEGGTFTIRISTIEVTGPSPIGLAEGSYAVLAIEDTGTGMPEDVVARAFEPFFTTKTSGGGTGLGLSMVYGFAKQSGGGITLTSELGRGTTLRLFLPLTGRAPLSIAHDETPAPPAAARTILVVEDEADVRFVVRRQLEILGHRVLVAEGATEGLLLIRGPGAPDLLLTDVVLASGMDGIELANAARKVRPKLSVIFMSGHMAVTEAQRRIRKTGAPLLSKPFTTTQLERVVNSVCAAADSR